MTMYGLIAIAGLVLAMLFMWLFAKWAACEVERQYARGGGKMTEDSYSAEDPEQRPSYNSSEKQHAGSVVSRARTNANPPTDPPDQVLLDVDGPAGGAHAPVPPPPVGRAPPETLYNL